MSEGRCTVVRVGTVTKHENADSLDVVRVWDYPVIVRRGDFAPGDLAIYIPVDSIVPTEDPRFSFLAGHPRIKAKKIRSVFSMGLLIKSEPGLSEGDDVTDLLRITRYEPPAERYATDTENEPDGSMMPHYTDIEGLRRWPDVLQPGEPVVITEKLHGANARFVWHGGRLWVGSRNNIKRRDERNLWWRCAMRYDLEEKLAAYSGTVVFGEVYGQAQDLKYNATNSDPIKFAAFDAFSLRDGKYLDLVAFLDFANRASIPCVPFLHIGPWNSGLRESAEGITRIGERHVREGIVIRPQTERYHDGLGRVILKLHGEGYLTRKEKKP